MADEQSMSVRDRIAQLKLNQVGRVPETPPAAYEQVVDGTTWTRSKRPPPPPPPARPTPPPRPNSVSVPTAQNGSIGNQPEGDHAATNGAVRPPLPSRTSTQQSLGVPSLPSRKVSEPSPSLPPRRPSETSSQPDYRLSRRDSNESISSVATGRSSISGVSTNTSITSGRSVKAPAFDPNALPALPPKRTDEEKRSYYDSGYQKNGRRPLKSTYSSPNVLPKQNGTTAPPAPRRPSAQQAQPLPLQIEPAPEAPARQVELAPAPAPAVKPPPQLPSRPSATPQLPTRPTPTSQLPARQVEPPPAPVDRPSPAQPPMPRQSALMMGFGRATQKAPSPHPPSRPTPSAATDSASPPPVPTSSRPDLAALQASKPKVNGSTAFQTPPPSQNLCLLCRDFSAPDQHAANFPRENPNNQDVTILAHQLCDRFPSPTDKARAIFTWLHHNIMYDTHAFFSGNLKPSTPSSTLATGWAVCEGYAGLFAALAMKAGLEAIVVGGNGKGYGYSQLQPGAPIPAFSAGHAWNAVKIDGGRWKLLDACWGAGHICGANNLYKKEFSPERFVQSNDEFGLDHFPEDSSRQFREDGRVVSWEEYITGNKRGCGAEFFSGYTHGEGISEPSFRPANNPIILSQQGPTVRFSFQKICPHWDPLKHGKGERLLYTLAIEAQEGNKAKNHLPFQTNGDVWWCDVPTRDLGTPGQTVQEYLEWKGKRWKGFDGAGVSGVEGEVCDELELCCEVGGGLTNGFGWLMPVVLVLVLVLDVLGRDDFVSRNEAALIVHCSTGLSRYRLRI